MEGIEHDLDKMRILDEINNTLPPEQKNRSWIIGKERIKKKMTTSATNELEKNIFRIKIERSCWKTNNENSKLRVGLWETSQNYEVKFCHYGNKRLD